MAVHKSGLRENRIVESGEEPFHNLFLLLLFFIFFIILLLKEGSLEDWLSVFFFCYYFKDELNM